MDDSQIVANAAGVIHDPVIHQRVVEEILAFTLESGFSVIAWIASPVLGPKGNVKFLAALRWM